MSFSQGDPARHFFGEDILPESKVFYPKNVVFLLQKSGSHAGNRNMFDQSGRRRFSREAVR